MKQAHYNQIRKHKKGIHEDTINILVNRLLNYHSYLWIKKHFYYNERGLMGEVDVLAYDKEFNFHHFYEIKSYYTKNNYRKAEEQFHRYLKAHPEQKVKGVYVTPKKVRRLI